MGPRDGKEEAGPCAGAKAASTPPATPSYYVASFHAHFFPHGYDPAVDASALPPRKRLSLPQRYAMSMARRPRTHLLTALVVALVLSFVGFRFGDFTVSIDNSGWWSRGTEIADRATQEMIVAVNRRELFADATGEVWEELMTVVQPDWQAPAEPAATPGNGTADGSADGSADAADAADAAADAENAAERARVCGGAWYG